MNADAGGSRPAPVAAPAGAQARHQRGAGRPGLPAWLSSVLAGNRREMQRLHSEILQIRGGIGLLMKQRNGGTWTQQDRRELKDILRRLSSVSPYLLAWLVPGSLLLLPLLAWRLDARRTRRERLHPPG